ncbi:MAG TPA: autotransporter domain-containing protein [Burkholderiales bacterium]|nr:autotransporter domain-containing protein [Burkholderiales bacterium]
MGSLRMRIAILGLALAAALAAAPAHAECGGSTQCIAIGLTPGDAAVAHHGGPAPATPTMAFGNQVTATTSASRTLYVAAVQGGVGMATLGPITITGTNAAEFTVTGGSCSTTNGPVHGGANCTITVAFAPTSLGAKDATLNVPLNPPPGCGGCITGRTAMLTGTGVDPLPAASPATLTTAIGTPATLDLAPFISGANLLGIRITVPPGNGSVSVSGTRVTYTPNANYVGSDTFFYESFNAITASAPAAVSVSVGSRADPSDDPNVTGLLGAQIATARRFWRAQIFNFQRRMESLHRSAPAPRSEDGARLASNAGVATQPPTMTDAGSGIVPTSLLAPLLSAANTRSLRLSSSGDGGDGASPLPPGTGIWIAGNVSFGNRDQGSASGGSRFSTDGISVGIDRRLNSALALGVGLGYARDETSIGLDGTRSKARGWSIAAYGSYQPFADAYVDGLLGYGETTYDSVRYVAAANDYASGTRKGRQLFASLAAGYEFHRNGVLLSPYARLDYASDRLGAFTEIGAGLNALRYSGQTLPSLQLGAGVRVESVHATNFGWVRPRLRLEYRHDFEGARAATVRYADQFAGPTYSVTPAGLDRDALVLGIGGDFVLRRGWQLGIDYQTQYQSGLDSAQAIRFWVAADPEATASPLGSVASSTLLEDPVRVEAGYVFDDNVNRARSADQLSDHVYSANVAKSTVIPLTENTRAILRGFVGGEKLHRFSGLDHLTAGAYGEFQYRASGDIDAPTFGVFGRAAYEGYSSSLRDGFRYTLGVNARQAVTDRLELFGALDARWRSARNTVFDGTDWGARLNLDVSFDWEGTLYLGGEYRRGDAVSSGPPTQDSASIAKSLVPDDAYPGRRLFAYRFDAETVLWTLGYNWPLGPRDSIDFSWRNVRSTATQQPSAAPGGVYAGPPSYYGVTLAPGTGGTQRYRVNQFSLVYLMRF